MLLVPLLAAGLSGTAAGTASASGLSPTGLPATAVATASAAAIPPICESRLPKEAGDTIRLIDRGGPFPYPKDGTVFQNREGLLPQKPRGFYREYTVKTPGLETRGARRIVTSGSEGRNGMYYTANHYRSFSDIDFTC
ncbi:ribonuclease [Actinomadura rudentiformis]|uniref:Ribonuclease n=2 Tax=Actinomadura rudentiformis TaxID=359158 RepID=A0A6H9YD11_9ACTN|nr:ribonuclease [Actinomadura rudentiformis]